jgi:hypothetical protein
MTETCVIKQKNERIHFVSVWTVLPWNKFHIEFLGSHIGVGGTPFFWDMMLQQWVTGS